MASPSIHSRVDDDHNIAMLYFPKPYEHFRPGVGPDHAMALGFNRYTNYTSEILTECRAECFCVLAHGVDESLTGVRTQTALGLVGGYYQNYGKKGRKNRKLLLLSCQTGRNFAQLVSKTFSIEVIAPSWTATITQAGEIECETTYRHNNAIYRPGEPKHKGPPIEYDWMYFSSGNGSRLGSKWLTTTEKSEFKLECNN